MGTPARANIRENFNAQPGEPLNAELIRVKDIPQEVKKRSQDEEVLIISFGAKSHHSKLHKSNDRTRYNSLNFLKDIINIQNGLLAENSDNHDLTKQLMSLIKKSLVGSQKTESTPDIRDKVFNNGEDWLSSAQLCLKAGVNKTLPNKWKKNNKIFAITKSGKDYYPKYALDENYHPLPVIADILNIFGDSKTSWGVAIWFASVNSYLGDKKPKDTVKNYPGSVLDAAVSDKQGIQHG